MANAGCARTCAVVKGLEDLLMVLKERPLTGPHDPRLAVAFEVALHGDDAELDAEQKEIHWATQLRAHSLRDAEQGH